MSGQQLKTCETCSAWSQLVAHSAGSAGVVALCLNICSDNHGRYTSSRQRCAVWSDDPSLSDLP